MSNPYRSEVKIDLAGTSLVMRPSFEALASMEGETGVGLVELVNRLGSGRFELKHLAAVIKAGVQGAGNKVPDNLGELILKAGVVVVLRQVNAWLVGVFAGEGGNTAGSDEGKA